MSAPVEAPSGGETLRDVLDEIEARMAPIFAIAAAAVATEGGEPVCGVVTISDRLARALLQIERDWIALRPQVEAAEAGWPPPSDVVFPFFDKLAAFAVLSHGSDEVDPATRGALHSLGRDLDLFAWGESEGTGALIIRRIEAATHSRRGGDSADDGVAGAGVTSPAASSPGSPASRVEKPVAEESRAKPVPRWGKSAENAGSAWRARAEALERGDVRSAALLEIIANAWAEAEDFICGAAKASVTLRVARFGDVHPVLVEAAHEMWDALGGASERAFQGVRRWQLEAIADMQAAEAAAVLCAYVAGNDTPDDESDVPVNIHRDLNYLVGTWDLPDGPERPSAKIARALAAHTPNN